MNTLHMWQGFVAAFQRLWTASQDTPQVRPWVGWGPGIHAAQSLVCQSTAFEIL